MNAKFVYVRRGGQTPPLTPLYSSPYEVMEAGRKVFKISISGKIEMFTVDRLKPHLGSAPLLAATPLVRGRPAKRTASGRAAPSGVGSEAMWRRSNVRINIGEAAYINLCVLPEKIREF